MHEQDGLIQEDLPPPDSDHFVSARLWQSIEHDLSSLRPQWMPSIHRVPRELREGNESHYTPTAISIGPLHATAERLKDAEELKKRFLASFLSRFRKPVLPHLICQLLRLERSARLSYAEDFKNLQTEEFAKMMLLDGCFIIELMLRFESGTITDVNDPILVGRARGPLLYNILQDLLLLENQLPFFILQALYKVVQDESSVSNTLVELTRILFIGALPVVKHSFSPLNSENFPSHLLELVLFTLFPRAVGYKNAKKMSYHSWQCMRSASDLALYGIKFADVRFIDSMEDVSFGKSKRGVLKMPHLDIQESTTSLFKNLLALEQCSYEKYSGFFTSFLILMDTLIDTEIDVEILVKAGVLESYSNDKLALLSLFNDLTAKFIYDVEKCHYAYVFEEMERYCSHPIRQFRAYFMRYCFASKWDILNGILLFVLTVTQTLFAILSYNPKD
ncbi:hypothetical protein NMG60_11026574 [Bertholletia excelsa]